MGTGRVADPTNRNEFKIYIRAKLGEPVIQVNVSDMQVDIAVDEALQYFRDYHYNGSHHSYYVKQLTDTDIANRYIDLPADIFSVNEVYGLNQTAFSLSADMFSGGYQMVLDIAFNLQNGSILSYYMNKTHYDFISSMVVGQSPIRYNQLQNRLYIDSTWRRYVTGDHIVVDCYTVVDPDQTPAIWSDRWLIRYATAKLKKQWGENLSKYVLPLPGGVTLNGERILREADEELRNIEENCIRDYSIPPRDVIA